MHGARWFDAHSHWGMAVSSPHRAHSSCVCVCARACGENASDLLSAARVYSTDRWLQSVPILYFTSSELTLLITATHTLWPESPLSMFLLRLVLGELVLLKLGSLGLLERAFSLSFFFFKCYRAFARVWLILSAMMDWNLDLPRVNGFIQEWGKVQLRARGVRFALSLICCLTFKSDFLNVKVTFTHYRTFVKCKKI